MRSAPGRTAVAALVLAACGAAPRPAASRIESSATLTDPASSAPVAIADKYRGKVVVLDFWASWCAQCRETVPQVVRLAAAFPDAVVLGVNEGDLPDDARSAAQAFGITYPIALDRDLTFFDRLGTTGLPTLVVVDRDGSIAHRAKHVDEETLATIRRLLAAPSASAPATPVPSATSASPTPSPASPSPSPASPSPSPSPASPPPSQRPARPPPSPSPAPPPP